VIDLQSAAKAPHIATLGLTEAVALLNTKNEAFDEKYGQRSVTNLSREATSRVTLEIPEETLATAEIIMIKPVETPRPIRKVRIEVVG
jgi:hypothetical protein